MRKEEIMEELYNNPVIMAIKNNKDFNKCLEADIRIVFVLYGNIETIPTIVKKLKSKDKIVIIHEDLIEGLSSSYYVASFIKKYTEADGIITTRQSNADYAKKLGLFSVLRYFLIDSLSYENMKESLKHANCDVIEILPGIIPKVIKQIHKRTSIPIIAGGLISEKEDVIEALNSKAIAISSSDYSVWEM